jgi:hypothetical protein
LSCSAAKGVLQVKQRHPQAGVERGVIGDGNQADEQPPGDHQVRRAQFFEDGVRPLAQCADDSAHRTRNVPSASLTI